MHQQATPASHFDLHLIEHFFAAEECRAIVNDMRQAPASAALTYGRGEGQVDERTRRVLQVSPSAQTVALVTSRLEQVRAELANHFQMDLSGYEPPQFLCYRVGDFFVAHQDGNTGMINLESDRTRRVSVSIFLNSQSDQQDTQSYDGGSLVFSDWRVGARHEVLGKAGALLAFRSERTHEVTPVTRGERFAIVTWYRVNNQP